MEDSKIIELYNSRNEQAIAETQQKYGALCDKIALGILNNGEDAEECVSSAYIKLWNAIPPKNPESLCGYLCAIVRNTAFTAYERIKRRFDHEHYDELAEVIPDEKTVEGTFESKEIGALINAYLETVSKKSREVFVSRYYFCMGMNEIATGLNMTESAVRTRLSRTRAGLRTYLEERGVEI